MPIDLVIDEREGAGSTTSKSPENLNDPTDLGSDQVRLAAILDAIVCGVLCCSCVLFTFVFLIEPILTCNRVTEPILICNCMTEPILTCNWVTEPNLTCNWVTSKSFGESALPCSFAKAFAGRTHKIFFRPKIRAYLVQLRMDKITIRICFVGLCIPPPVHVVYVIIIYIVCFICQSRPRIDWLQSLNQFFINVSYHILVASLTLMALFFINVSYHILVASLTLMALF